MTLLVACSQAVSEAEIDDLGCACALDSLMIDVNDLIDDASDALCQISGGVMCGRCTTVRRPCSDACYCGCEWACNCCRVRGIPLDSLGVNPTIEEIKLDGSVFTSWAIVESQQEGRKLVRTDDLLWPGSQNILHPSTEVGTFEITVETGLAWSWIGKMAAYELVCEMAAAATNAPTKLPPGTVGVTADGVAIAVGRLPGEADLEAVGLTWLARFRGNFGRTVFSDVRSPELMEGWTLPVVTFNP